MWLIIILVAAGVLLLVAELILIPGLSVAGICALVCYGAAVYIGFDRFGAIGGAITIGAIVGVSVAAALISLRARTWHKLALNDNIDGTSQQLPSDTLKVGDRGVAATRLAPSGKVVIGAETYEARTMANIYVDARSGVEVVDFENFTVIVRPLPKEEAE